MTGQRQWLYSGILFVRIVLLHLEATGLSAAVAIHRPLSYMF